MESMNKVDCNLWLTSCVAFCVVCPGLFGRAEELRGVWCPGRW